MARAVRLVAVVLLIAAAGGCGASAAPETPVAATAVRTGPLTPTDPGRVPPTAAAAIAALAAVASPDPPAGEHHGHSQVGPQEFVPLDAPEQALLDEQWAAALAAVPGLDSVAEAEAAGYLRAAAQGAGVGVHYVKWELIDQPFDPAAPSMLLFDEREGPHQGDLVGYSYWLRSDTEPDGFAGPNDHWHQHQGICVVNGFVDREGAAGPETCAGDYFGGADLWMLHTWLIPGWENRWGPFTTLNPSLCPSEAGTPELARCPDDEPVL